MPAQELEAELMRAVELARQATEHDAAEARKRTRGVSSPASSPVATLAAGLVVADAILDVRPAEEQGEVPSEVAARDAAASGQTGATRARRAKGDRPRTGKRRRGRMLRLRHRG